MNLLLRMLPELEIMYIHAAGSRIICVQCGQSVILLLPLFPAEANSSKADPTQTNSCEFLSFEFHGRLTLYTLIHFRL